MENPQATENQVQPTNVETKVSTEGTPAQTSATVPETTGTQQVSTEGQAAPQVPQYVPNTKFKFLNQEGEFDPVFKTILKDKEVEEKVRQLHAKAHGLDFMKTRYQETKTKHEQLESSVQRIQNYIKEGDYDSFFEALQIPEQTLYKYVLSKLNQRELPEEQQQLFQQNRQHRRTLEETQAENAQLQRQFEQQQTYARDMELSHYLMRPEYTSFVSSYDSQLGPGSFRNEVINRGIVHLHATGEDISVEQAVAKTIAALNLQTRAGVMPQSGNMPGAKQLPVIPNIGGGTASPMKKVAKNLDDLRKLGKEFPANA